MRQDGSLAVSCGHVDHGRSVGLGTHENRRKRRSMSQRGPVFEQFNLVVTDMAASVAFYEAIGVGFEPAPEEWAVPAQNSVRPGSPSGRRAQSVIRGGPSGIRTLDRRTTSTPLMNTCSTSRRFWAKIASGPVDWKAAGQRRGGWSSCEIRLPRMLGLDPPWRRRDHLHHGFAPRDHNLEIGYTVGPSWGSLRD